MEAEAVLLEEAAQVVDFKSKKRVAKSHSLFFCEGHGREGLLILRKNRKIESNVRLPQMYDKELYYVTQHL